MLLQSGRKNIIVRSDMVEPLLLCRLGLARLLNTRYSGWRKTRNDEKKTKRIKTHVKQSVETLASCDLPELMQRGKDGLND